MFKKILICFLSLHLLACASKKIDELDSKNPSVTSSIIKVPYRYEKESLMGYNPFTRQTQWGTDFFEITGYEEGSGKHIYKKLKKFLYSINSLQVEPGNYIVTATCSTGVNYVMFLSAKIELVVKPGKTYFLECEENDEIKTGVGVRLHLIEKEGVSR